MLVSFGAMLGYFETVTASSQCSLCYFMLCKLTEASKYLFNTGHSDTPYMTQVQGDRPVETQGVGQPHALPPSPVVTKLLWLSEPTVLEIPVRSSWEHAGSPGYDDKT